MSVNVRKLRRLAGVATAALAIAALTGCDGSECAPSEPQEHQVTTMTYLFREAWWECPMGCVYNRYWYFRCKPDTIEFVGSWDAAAGDERPDWWERASVAKTFLMSARDCSIATWDRCSDLSKTPREDREAEEAALWLTGSLVAPDSMYSRILGDLGAIRAAYGDTIPQLGTLSFRPPWTSNQLVLELSDEGMQQFLRGEYRELDSLNGYFGVSGSKHTFDNWVLLTFSRRLNPFRLADIYEAVGSVLIGEPSGFFGDYPNVYPWREVETLGVTMGSHRTSGSSGLRRRRHGSCGGPDVPRPFPFQAPYQPNSPQASIDSLRPTHLNRDRSILGTSFAAPQ